MTMALNSSWMSEKAGCRSLVEEEPKTGWRIDFFALPDRNDIVENLLENAKIDRFFQRAQRSAHPFAELCGIGGYENNLDPEIRSKLLADPRTSGSIGQIDIDERHIDRV